MRIDWQTIRHSITGKASEKEVRQYEAWLNESESNQEYVEKIRNFYATNGKIDFDDQKTAENREKFVKQCMKIQCGRARRKIFIRSTVAAASVILIFFWVFNNSNTVEQADQIVEPIANNSGIRLITQSGKLFNIENPDDKKSLAESKQISFQQKNISYTGESANEAVEYHTLTVPRGKDWQITLSDGTTVHLNAESELTFPSKFSTDSARVVTLKGEAYFDVMHSDKSQFIVQMDHVDVKVYGTQFNINTHHKGYIETTLIKGSIAIGEHFIRPDEAAIYDYITKKVTIHKVNGGESIAWCRNMFLFRNLPLGEIMESIARWYNIEVEFKNQELKNKLIYLSAPRTENITNILDAISKDERIRYIKKENRVTIL